MHGRCCSVCGSPWLWCSAAAGKAARTLPCEEEGLILSITTFDGKSESKPFLKRFGHTWIGLDNRTGHTVYLADRAIPDGEMVTFSVWAVSGLSGLLHQSGTSAISSITAATPADCPLSTNIGAAQRNAGNGRTGENLDLQQKGKRGQPHAVRWSAGRNASGWNWKALLTGATHPLPSGRCAIPSRTSMLRWKGCWSTSASRDTSIAVSGTQVLTVQCADETRYYRDGQRVERDSHPEKERMERRPMFTNPRMWSRRNKACLRRADYGH
ncbi:MAG: hypothetical protein ACLVJH_13415 [Faecalibacterium prausnitzii]